MKRIVSLVLTVILPFVLLPAFPITSYAAVSGAWEYMVSDGAATLTKYSGTANIIAVPTPSGGTLWPHCPPPFRETPSCCR